MWIDFNTHHWSLAKQSIVQDWNIIRNKYEAIVRRQMECLISPHNVNHFQNGQKLCSQTFTHQPYSTVKLSYIWQGDLLVTSSYSHQGDEIQKTIFGDKIGFNKQYAHFGYWTQLWYLARENIVQDWNVIPLVIQIFVIYPQNYNRINWKHRKYWCSQKQRINRIAIDRKFYIHVSSRTC